MKKLKQFREERGWTQERLEKESGVPQSTISELESGKRKNPSLFAIKKIADALGVTTDDLLDDNIPKAANQ